MEQNDIIAERKKEQMIRALMDTHQIEMYELLGYIEKLSLVKKHLHGDVRIVVTKGRAVNFEGIVRTQFSKEEIERMIHDAV